MAWWRNGRASINFNTLSTTRENKHKLQKMQAIIIVEKTFSFTGCKYLEEFARLSS